MSDMTVTQVREARQHCQRQIGNLLKAFESATGCFVDAVYFEHAEALGQKPEIVNVKMDVEIGRDN